MNSFSASVDATSYIYASEIFPTPARARGLAISVSGLFIATIIFLQVAPTAFDAVGWKYYLVFICITSVIFGITWVWFPEVGQLSLLQEAKASNINSEFRRGRYLWKRSRNFSIPNTLPSLRRLKWSTRRQWQRLEHSQRLIKR